MTVPDWLKTLSRVGCSTSVHSWQRHFKILHFQTATLSTFKGGIFLSLFLYASLFPALPSTLFISLPFPSLSPSSILSFLFSSPLFSSSLSSGLTKEGGEITNENADSLEEIFSILAEEGSDWFHGFFTFLYDVITPPVEKVEDPESETAEEEGDAGTSQNGAGVQGVILDLQDQ